MVNKNFFYQKVKVLNNLCITDFYLQDVGDDGNCGYRCISLQLYGNENEFGKIRDAVYTYLDSNREEFTNYNFEKDGNIITSDKYIDTIKNNDE